MNTKHSLLLLLLVSLAASCSTKIAPSDLTQTAFVTELPPEKATEFALIQTNPPPPLPGPTPGLGIIQLGDGPYPPEVYTILNRWNGLGPNGDLIVVFAGGRTNTSQGMVIVVKGSVEKEYQTPAACGAVKVTAEKGLILTLTTEDGRTSWLFDTLNEQFDPSGPTACP